MILMLFTTFSQKARKFRSDFTYASKSHPTFFSCPGGAWCPRSFCAAHATRIGTRILLGAEATITQGGVQYDSHREPAPSLFPAPGHLTGFRESTAFDRARGSPSPGYPLLGRRRVDPGGRQEGPWSGVRVRVAMLPDHPGPGLLPRRAEGGGAGVFFFSPAKF